MGRVVYSMNVSLDGFVATRDGGVDWGRVDEEVGAGLPFLPAGAPRTELELATTHRSGSGTVLLGYRAPAGYDRGRP